MLKFLISILSLQVTEYAKAGDPINTPMHNPKPPIPTQLVIGQSTADGNTKNSKNSINTIAPFKNFLNNSSLFRFSLLCRNEKSHSGSTTLPLLLVVDPICDRYRREKKFIIGIIDTTTPIEIFLRKFGDLATSSKRFSKVLIYRDAQENFWCKNCNEF